MNNIPFSASEYARWFDNLSREQQAREIAKIDNIKFVDEPNGSFYPVGVQHDYWNAYAYGNEIKIVYFKRGVIHQKECKSNYEKNECNAVNESEKKARFESSLSRTKTAVFELAACNEFQYFCTLTLDKTKYDRYNLTKFRKDFAQLIRNLNRNRDNKIEYLSIPEPHKDGAWHIHSLMKGLLNDDLTAFKLSDNIPNRIKSQIRGGKAVYNWETYSKRFGFFTATEIENQSACSRYVTKYITKNLKSVLLDSGSHLYFASQGLKRREIIVKGCFDECPFSQWDYENDYVKIATIKLS